MPARDFKLTSHAMGLVEANLTSSNVPGGGSVPARGFKLISHQVLCLPGASS